MPTYEYRCDSCDHQFELFQSIKAEPVRKCPACGRRKVRRLISGGGAILFKGAGFYSTDYRSESYKQAAKRETEGKSAGATSAGKGGGPKSDGPGKADKGASGKAAAAPASTGG